MTTMRMSNPRRTSISLFLNGFIGFLAIILTRLATVSTLKRGTSSSLKTCLPPFYVCEISLNAVDIMKANEQKILS
jgi:hypothetical protein